MGYFFLDNFFLVLFSRNNFFLFVTRERERQIIIESVCNDGPLCHPSLCVFCGNVFLPNFESFSASVDWPTQVSNISRRVICWIRSFLLPFRYVFLIMEIDEIINAKGFFFGLTFSFPLPLSFTVIQPFLDP